MNRGSARNNSESQSDSNGDCGGVGSGGRRPRRHSRRCRRRRRYILRMELQHAAASICQGFHAVAHARVRAAADPSLLESQGTERARVKPKLRVLQLLEASTFAGGTSRHKPCTSAS